MTDADRGQTVARSGHGNVIRSLCLDDRNAVVRELQRIGVDPTGIAVMADKALHQTILVPQVRPAAANILKQEMLALGGDAAVTRGTISCTVPETDVLLMGTIKQLKKLCDKLKAQPFGLSTIGSTLALLLSSDTVPPYWQTARRRLTLTRPLVMGILNLTPDSFSDGGRYTDRDAALAHAEAMVAAGADLLDIGAESTRPGAFVVDAAEEISRVEPIVRLLASRLSTPLSVDTWKSTVATAALDAGAEIINDISGATFDADMPRLIAQRQAGVVLMHTRGTPDNLHPPCQYQDLMAEVSDELSQAAKQVIDAGASPAQIVLDPGIGLPKDVTQNLTLLRRLPEFQSLGYPLLVGTSRKTFIGKILNQPDPADRLFGTAATVAWSVMQGAHIIRVHDVAAMAAVVQMTTALTAPVPPEVP